MPDDRDTGPGLAGDPLNPPREAKADDRAVSDPYVPQEKGIDAAAGGADSSPYENLPTGERKPAAERAPGPDR
jgi:hypothetical protein